MISVIILQHNGVALTQACLRSFLRYHGEEHEVIVVDNASTESYGKLQVEFPAVRLIGNSTNAGFSAANNMAARSARGDILLFLNNDTLFDGEVCESILQVFNGDRRIGVVGPRLLYPDGAFQLSAGTLPSFWREISEKWFYAMERNRLAMNIWRGMTGHHGDVGWVTGAALFIRRSVFEQVGGFDEKLFMYFEDKDLCCRVREAGYRIIYAPTPSLIHLKGGSTKSDSAPSLRTTYRKSQLHYYHTHRARHEQWLLRAYLRMINQLPRN
jgi:GT2 family glycosyltransferase